MRAEKSPLPRFLAANNVSRCMPEPRGVAVKIKNGCRPAPLVPAYDWIGRLTSLGFPTVPMNFARR